MRPTVIATRDDGAKLIALEKRDAPGYGPAWVGQVELADGTRTPIQFLEAIVLYPDAWDWIEDSPPPDLA